MNIGGINNRIGIKAPIEKVYAALTTAEGISAWWGPTTGISSVGSTINVSFPATTLGFKVTALVPNKQVTWEAFSVPPYWEGTKISFALTTEGDFTIILFSHRGWKKEDETMAHCSTKWAVFLLSLKSLIEEGKGSPSPHDRKIDNWN
jgi:uncharacterized protein YndB with AHSA1/START domain